MDFGISWVSQNSTIKFIRNYVEERIKEGDFMDVWAPDVDIKFHDQPDPVHIWLNHLVIESIPMSE